MGHFHNERAVPVEPHIAPDAAVVHKPERRHERRAAADDEMLAAHLAQETHRAAHALCAALRREIDRRGGIEEIELHKIKAPVGEHAAEHVAQVLRGLRMVKIDRIEAAPVHAAVPRLAVYAQQPVLVPPEDLRILLADERREPEPRAKALFMDPVRRAAQSLREFLRVRRQPVAHGGLPAVVDLEYIALGENPGAAGEIGEDAFLVDILIAVVPA